MTAVETYRDSMTERALQDAIIKAARQLNYLVFHCRDSRTNEPGFPDLLIVGHGRIIAWELKTATGKLRKARISKSGRWLPGQDDWLAAFNEAGAHECVIRPADLDWALGWLQQEAS